MDAQRQPQPSRSTFSAEVSCTPLGLMGTTRLLSPSQVAARQRQLPKWQVVGGHHIQRTFSFDKFSQVQTFTRHVENISHVLGHHPHLFVSFDAVRIELWTHPIDGLTGANFDLAEQIEGVLSLP